MSDQHLSNLKIMAAYLEKTSKSARLADEAKNYLPSGISHDVRHCNPHGIYIDRAAGSRKWDVDGNEYVDYFGGHGAHLLGHNDPRIMAAIGAALAKGTHFGSSHAIEVRWAELVLQLLPGADRVRFTSSGTEATHLALRLARAYNGRKKLLRFRSNFHGWHDHMTSGYISHWDGAPTTGVLPEIAANVVLVDPGNLENVSAALEANPDDIAAIILEPTGATFGMLPMAPGFLAGLRKLATDHGSVLIFDEVVTGFRVAPGGAQGESGVTPDLTTLGKILAGGLPGGAVAGRKEILDILDFAASADRGVEKIVHYGTYNGNPVCAAAGVAMLEIIAEGDACERASKAGANLRARLNQMFEADGTPWAAYGTHSGLHIFTNPRGEEITPTSFDPFDQDFEALKTNPPGLSEKFRMALIANGVDMNPWPGGLVSAAHSDEDIELTVDGAAKAVHMLRHDGEL